MARYVIVSTDTADKVIKAGPILWDGTSVLDITADRMAILAADATSSGYTFPPRPATEQNRAMMRSRLLQALAANAAYLGLPTPTNAQNTVHLRLVTQELSALIRLILEQLNTTDGT
jgi:hypothetical protein